MLIVCLCFISKYKLPYPLVSPVPTGLTFGGSGGSLLTSLLTLRLVSISRSVQHQLVVENSELSGIQDCEMLSESDQQGVKIRIPRDDRKK